MTTGGKTKYRYRVRCRAAKCYHRFHLKGKPLNLDLIECPICGGPVKETQTAHETQMAKRDYCWCNGVPFRPHEKGTILGCDHHPVHPDDWTIEQERQAQSMLATPRSG